ncbi:hypothetical protein ACQPZ8_29365 [Actinomadura nitritigenes]|uniref:hypothetical protein n=1 Tax=Actinomadura nitritigenes TaxID=134602 RepID=UPI003D8DFED6
MVNFLVTDPDHPADMTKHRLKVIQHHPDVINGCLAPTGLTLNTTPATTNLSWLGAGLRRAMSLRAGSPAHNTAVVVAWIGFAGTVGAPLLTVGLPALMAGGATQPTQHRR